MLRDGVIPRFVHGLVEYVAGVLLIAAPFLFDYGANAAVAVSVVLGVLVIGIAASTEGPTSLTNAIKIDLHVILDYVLAVVLIATPFIFGFSGEGAPTAVFIVLGVAHLLITIGTRFKPAR